MKNTDFFIKLLFCLDSLKFLKIIEQLSYRCEYFVILDRNFIEKVSIYVEKHVLE